MANSKDLTGSRVRGLLLLKRKRENNRTYYYCKCDCGNEKWIRSDILNKTENCGCNRKYRFKDLANERFGKLVALQCVGVSKNNGYIWSCKCDCGNYKNIPTGNLISGTSLSCGCLQKDKARQNVKKAFETFKDKNLVENTNISFLKLEKPIKSNTSKVTGVSFNISSQMWVAYIGFKKKRYHLGFYKNKEEAILARKKAEENIHKKFLDWYEDFKNNNLK